MTDTALVIIPKEAELLYPLICDAKQPVTYLFTYAAPVTRKMLHFNHLGYYALPSLPTGWKPPMWLAVELGIFTGRLYFEFEEYGELCKYLGLHGDGKNIPETSDDAAGSIDLHATDAAADDTPDGAEVATSAQKPQSFTENPLTFLQDYLAVRRKGQDFSHTPMGHVCQGKQLTASHPFFTRFDSDGDSNSNNASVRNDQERKGSPVPHVERDVPSDEEIDEDDGDSDQGGND